MMRQIKLTLGLILIIVNGQSTLSEDVLSVEKSVDYVYQGKLEFQPSKGYLKAKWQIRVIEQQNNKIRFFIRHTLNNLTVSGPSIIKQSISEVEGFTSFWAIDLELDPQQDNRLLEMSYEGVLLPEPMENKINSIESDKIELNVDSFWHPIDASFSKLLTVDLEIEILSETKNMWQGVSTGEVINTMSGMTIKNNRPALDIPIALSNRFKINQIKGIALYDLRDTNKGQEQLVTAALYCKKHLNKLYGKSETLPESRFLITTREASGYSRKNYIAFTDISEKTPENLTQVVCHEFAHFWSAGGNFNTVENWLNESFAEYAGLIAIREEFGQAAFEQFIEKYKKQISGKELTPIWVEGDTKRKSYLVQYRKGPLALYELEKKIGLDKFQQFITVYMINRIAHTETLLDELKKITNEDAMLSFKKSLAQ